MTFDPEAPGGFVVHSQQATTRVCRDNVRALLAEAENCAATPTLPRKASNEDPARIAYALKLWDEAVDPRGTPAEVYLRSSGLDINAEIAGGALRWHPRLKRRTRG